MVNETYKCPSCDLAEPVVRFGFNRCGTQRLRCKTCCKTWTPKARSRQLVAGKASVDRIGIDRIGIDRIGIAGAAFPTRHCSHLQGGAHHNPRPAQKKSREARLSFPDTILPAIKGDALEIDELVIRFRVKRRYRYLWLAISRLTRQVIGWCIGVGWCIGDRSIRSLKRLWFSLPAAYRRKLVYSDFYRAYAKWFAPWQHRPRSKGSGKTSIVEGLNNKWRNRISGLAEKPFV